LFFEEVEQQTLLLLPGMHVVLRRGARGGEQVGGTRIHPILQNEMEASDDHE